MQSRRRKQYDPPGPRRAAWEWVVLAAAAVVLIAFRLHAFPLPLETDECNYAYIGGRLLQGDRLYVDVWDHQPPGVFILFAAVIAVFGDAPEVFRWLAVAFSLASLVLIHAIARHLAGPPAAALAAVLFAIVSSDPGTAGEGCNREIYMTTLILAAWYAGLRRADGVHWIAASGLFLALASSVKPVVAVHWLLLAAWIMVSAAHPRVSDDNRVAPAVRMFVAVAAFAAGPVLLWAATLAYFALTGRWAEFVDALFIANVGYTAAQQGLLTRFAQFLSPPRHPFIFDSAWALWLSGGIASIWLLVTATIGRDNRRSLLAILVIAAFLAVCLPGRFWPHYYYLLIAPLVLAAAVGVASLAAWMLQILEQAGGQPRSILRRGCTAILFASVPAAAFATQYRDYLSRPSLQITLERYNTRDFWGRAQGYKVRRATDPGDAVFVFGSDAAIYYYSGRRCASRFTMLTALAPDIDGADRRRETLLRELRADLPKLILVLFDLDPWPAWKDFLGEHYGQAIGMDVHDHTGQPIMFVFARKGTTVPEIEWNWDREDPASP